MKKRLIALICAISMCVSQATPALAAEETMQIAGDTDVTEEVEAIEEGQTTEELEIVEEEQITEEPEVIEEEQITEELEVITEEVTEETESEDAYTGWESDDYYTYYYYNGEKVEECICFIDGYYYAFNYWGELYMNTRTSVGLDPNGLDETYDYEYGYIRANEDGKLCSNEWYEDENGNLEYHPEGGLAVGNTIVEIDGASYYMNDYCYVVTNQQIMYNETLYSADENGVLTEIDTSTLNGWQEIDGEKAYFVDGVMQKDTFVTVDGIEYYVDDNGYLVGEGVYWYRAEDKYYLIEADGSVVHQSAGSLYVTSSGAKYCYIEDDTLAHSEFVEIDGAKYYCGYYGEVYCGRINLYDSESGSDYYILASEEGVVFTEEGWAEYDSYKYYIDENGHLVCGQIKEIGGNKYYFSSSGYLVIGKVQIYDQETGSYLRMLTNEEGAIYTEAGWYEYDYDAYYVDESGYLVCGQFKEIDGKTYYFASSGYLRTGSFSIWDEEAGKNIHYKTDENGAIYNTPGWYEDENRNKFYIDESGTLVADTFMIIDGNKYYFSSSGYLRIGTISIWDSEAGKDIYYKTDANGVIIETTGWYEDEYGNKYYFDESGSLVTDTFMTIDGNKYHFDYSGAVTTGKFHLYDEEFGAYVNILANEEGVIYTESGWAEYEGNKYYIDENGHVVCEQFLEIDGNEYYFDYSGCLKTGIFDIYDEETGKYESLLADENGVIVRTVGWFKYGGQTYYIKENGYLACDEVYTIDGNDYYFDYDGWLITGFFSYWDDELGKSVYVLTESDGIIIRKTSELYTAKNGYTYYFKEDGTLARNELVTIDGVSYYFGYSGYRESGVVEIWDEETQKYNYMLADENGILVVVEKSGWYIDEEGNKYYFLDTRHIVVNQIYVIDGKEYYFNYNGKLRTGAVWVSDESEDGGCYMLVSEDGIIVRHEQGWYEDEEGNKYYFFEQDHILVNEVCEIDGKTYAFNWDGQVRTNYLMWINERDGYFLTDADGALIEDSPNEWYTNEEGDTYYFKTDCSIANEEILTIDGVDYCFGYQGELRSGRFSIYNPETGEREVHLADENGILVKAEPGWYEYDGLLYFFKENNVIASEEIVEFDGNEYIIDYYGHPAEGVQEVYDKESEEWVNVLAGENGLLIRHEIGWYTDEDGNVYYFFEQDHLISETVYVIDGVEYGFSDGRLRANRMLWDDDQYIVTDENGVVIRETAIWYEHDYCGTLYFKEDGSLACGEIISIDGEEYVFDDDCKLVNGTYRYWDEDLDKTVCILVDEGKIITADEPGWYMYDGEKYYFKDSKYIAANEILEINGVEYGFNSWGNLRSGTFYDNTLGKMILTDENGVVVKADKGWYEVYGITYYFKGNNILAVDELVEIDEKTYAFDWDGSLLHNQIYSYWDDEAEKEITVLLGNDGAVIKGVTGWYENSETGGKYYFKADGNVAYGEMLEIDGKKYYFNYSGQMVIGSFSYYDESRDEDVRLLADENGVIIETSGWVTVNNRKYYVLEDGTVARTVLEIDGNLYGFNTWNGKLQYGYFEQWNDEIDDSICYIADENGVIQTDGWVEYGFDLFYAGTDGKLVQSEWSEDGQYYFLYGGVATTGIHLIDDEYYQFAGDGKLIGKVEGFSEWNKVDGFWFYYDANQEPYTGWVDDTYYVEDGIMVFDSIIRDENDDLYYMNALGEKGIGWVDTNYGTAYAESDGKLVTGWQEIDEVTYYFDSDGCIWNYGEIMMMDGPDGKEALYVFGYDGACQGTLSGQDGWVEVPGLDYQVYFVDGEMLTYTFYEIDGKTYYFGYSGRMYTDELRYSEDGPIYINEDGIVEIPEAGWHKYGSTYFYVDEDGKIVTGLQNINGEDYYFYEDGEMAIGLTYIGEQEKYVIADVNGGFTDIVNGWNTYTRNGNTYKVYIVNGEMAEGFLTVDGILYCFENGRIVTGRYYYFDKIYLFRDDGSLARNEWVKIGNRSYYADAYGRTLIGEHEIDGLKYWFNNYGQLILSEEEPVTHIWDDGVVTKEPTCQETGILAYTCTECGITKTSAIGMADHIWNEEPTVEKEATCTETGLQSIHCATCNIAKNDTMEIIPAKGHQYDGLTCTQCDQTISVDINESVYSGVVDVIATVIAGGEAADELVESGVISEETKAAIQDAVDNNYTISATSELTVVNSDSVDKAAKTAIEEQATNRLGEENVKYQYIQTELIMQANGQDIGSVNKLTEESTFTVEIPEELKLEDGIYLVYVYKNETAQVVEASVNEETGEVTFTTDTFGTFALVSGPKPEGILGDVNGDETIDTSDAQAIFNHFMGIATISDDMLPFADINRDGSIDTSDAQAAFNMFMGIM